MRRSLRSDLQINVFRRNKYPICVFEPTNLDTIKPDGKCFAEGSARFPRGTNEVGNRGAACLDDAIAHPSHPSRMLDAVFVTKPEVTRKICAHGVGVEHNSIEQWR